MNVIYYCINNINIKCNVGGWVYNRVINTNDGDDKILKSNYVYEKYRKFKNCRTFKKKNKIKLYDTTFRGKSQKQPYDFFGPAQDN